MKLRAIGALATAFVLLAACGSDEPGTATVAPGPTTSAASVTTTAETSEETTTSATTVTTSETTEETTDDTGTVEPADLDDASIAWFSAFCGSFTTFFEGMGEALSIAMSTSGATSPSDMQASLVTAYDAMGTALIDSAEQMSTMPPPGFENGEVAAETVISALTQLGEAIQSATATFAETEVTDEESLSDALDALTAEIDAASADLDEQFGDMDSLFGPDLEAAVNELPACAGMGMGE